MRGRCMAIVARRRCKRGANWAMSVCFGWDPVKGEGIEGPDVHLCVQHGNGMLSRRDGKRLRVVRGWYGRIWNAEAKVWTVLDCVFRSRTTHKGSLAYWALRRPSKFGVCLPRRSYDEVRKDGWP